MKRHISFGSIEQFRNVLKAVQHTAQYDGLDDEGRPIYNRSAKLPTIEVTATEKIHGTNAGVSYCTEHGLWVQSRNNIITPEKDNANCATFVENHKKEWLDLLRYVASTHNINLDTHIVTIFFEWSGGNIQKISALTGLKKQAIIFQHFKVSPLERLAEDDGNNEVSRWIETRRHDGDPFHIESIGVHNILNNTVWEFPVNFEAPASSQNFMVDLVNVVEAESPLGVKLGVNGNTGEGIVCTFEYNGSVQRFKVKGEKHSPSKVKTMEPVDVEAEAAKIDFANYAASAARLEQAFQNVFGIENEIQEPHIKFTGDVVKAVINDVRKEESDIMEEKGLEIKDVGGLIGKITARWFHEQLDKDVGLK